MNERNEPPWDGAKFNCVRLGGDFVGEGFGLSTVEEDDPLGILGGELWSRGSSRRDQRRSRRRRVVVVVVAENGGVFVHVGDVLNCPVTMVLEASDLAPQTRIGTETVLKKRRVRVPRFEGFVWGYRKWRRRWRGRHSRRSPPVDNSRIAFLVWIWRKKQCHYLATTNHCYRYDSFIRYCDNCPCFVSSYYY